jgi:hypothetical protein
MAFLHCFCNTIIHFGLFGWGVGYKCVQQLSFAKKQIPDTLDLKIYVQVTPIDHAEVVKPGQCWIVQ